MFDLGAALFDAGQIPADGLRSALESRRSRPLEYALQPSGGWSDVVFPSRPAG